MTLIDPEVRTAPRPEYQLTQQERRFIGWHLIVAIAALSIGAAALMQKLGVTCNVILPRGRTAMTESMPHAHLFAAPKEGFDVFDPANVAPLVGYLASPEAAHISGELFVVWGGQVSIVQRPRLDVSYNNPQGGKWDLGVLHQTLSDYFNDKHRPVIDGYALPPA